MRSRRSIGGVLVGVVLLSACAGSNLFQIAAFLGEEGPTVQISSPTDGFTLAQGASLQVAASAEAPDGLGSATVKGVYKDTGTAAFAQQVVTYQAATAAEINRTLASTNAGPGAVWVIVEVSDALGEIAADTVSISIN